MPPVRPRFPVDRRLVHDDGTIRQPWSYFFLTLSEQVGSPGDYAVVSDHRISLKAPYSAIEYTADGRTLGDGNLHFPTFTGDVLNTGLATLLKDVGTPAPLGLYKLSTDYAGRVTGTTTVQASDLTPLLDPIYVNQSGDTMSGLLSVPSLQLQGGSSTEGTITYDPANRTASLDTGNGSSLQLGMESRLLGYNRTGSTILNGQVVYILGAHADQVEIALADNSTEATAAAVGIATEDIPNNSAGLVTTFGAIHDLSTHSFSEGSKVWLGSAGSFVATAPALPAKQIPLGFVVRSHPNQGIIFVRTESSSTVTELGPVLNTDLTVPAYWYVQYAGIIKRVNLSTSPFLVQYCVSTDWANRYTLTYI